jgi:hypothetical protein
VAAETFFPNSAELHHKGISVRFLKNEEKVEEQTA